MNKYQFIRTYENKRNTIILFNFFSILFLILRLLYVFSFGTDAATTKLSYHRTNLRTRRIYTVLFAPGKPSIRRSETLKQIESHTRPPQERGKGGNRGSHYSPPPPP